MKTIFLSIVIFCSSLAFATIVPVGGAAPTGAGSNCNTFVGGTSVTCTYSPTTGNVVVLDLQLSNTGSTGIVCKDSASNAMSVGPVATAGSGSPSVNVFSFAETMPSGITGFTCTWTTTCSASIAVEEYSGVASFNLSLAGNTATGTGTAASITLTPTVSNSWIVCGYNNQQPPSGSTFTTGNVRQSFSSSSPDVYLADNTESGTGSYMPCAATLGSSNNWGFAVIELKPAAGGLGSKTVGPSVLQ